MSKLVPIPWTLLDRNSTHRFSALFRRRLLGLAIYVQSRLLVIALLIKIHYHQQGAIVRHGVNGCVGIVDRVRIGRGLTRLNIDETDGFERASLFQFQISFGVKASASIRIGDLEREFVFLDFNLLSIALSFLILILRVPFTVKFF